MRAGRLLLVAVALLAAAVWPSAGSAGAGVSGRVVFYSDVANTVPGSPLARNVPTVRPKLVLLTQDGSAVIEKLRWSSWGGSIARATGISSASNCNPNCADGKRTHYRVDFVLSNRRRLFGRTVYSCYEVTYPRARDDLHSCLKHDHGKQYYYVPVSASPARDVAPPCLSHQLVISLGALTAALGHLALSIRFRDTGGTCSLRGFPRVYGLTKRGQVIRAKRALEGYFGRWRIATIPLKNGETASALLEGLDPAFLPHRPRSARSFRIMPPNVSHAVRRRTSYPLCYLIIHPVVAGLNGGGR